MKIFEYDESMNISILYENYCHLIGELFNRMFDFGIHILLSLKK